MLIRVPVAVDSRPFNSAAEEVFEVLVTVGGNFLGDELYAFNRGIHFSFFSRFQNFSSPKYLTGL